MTYEQFTETLAILKHAKNYLRSQGKVGTFTQTCKTSIARNQAINLLNDAEHTLVGEVARDSVRCAYNALPTTASPADFLAGHGNWGLTEDENEQATALAKRIQGKS